MKRYSGRYLLVVEGSIPADGACCMIAGKAASAIFREAAAGAKAIIAVGNCACFGGIPKAAPNPTGAMGVGELIAGIPLVLHRRLPSHSRGVQRNPRPFPDLRGPSRAG